MPNNNQKSDVKKTGGLNLFHAWMFFTVLTNTLFKVVAAENSNQGGSALAPSTPLILDKPTTLIAPFPKNPIIFQPQPQDIKQTKAEEAQRTAVALFERVRIGKENPAEIIATLKKAKKNIDQAIKLGHQSPSWFRDRSNIILFLDLHETPTLKQPLDGHQINKTKEMLATAINDSDIALAQLPTANNFYVRAILGNNFATLETDPCKKQEQLNKAQDAINQAIQLGRNDPAYPEYFHGRALINSARAELEKNPALLNDAMKDIDEAIKLNPKDSAFPLHKEQIKKAIDELRVAAPKLNKPKIIPLIYEEKFPDFSAKKTVGNSSSSNTFFGLGGIATAVTIAYNCRNYLGSFFHCGKKPKQNQKTHHHLDQKHQPAPNAAPVVPSKPNKSQSIIESRNGPPGGPPRPRGHRR